MQMLVTNICDERITKIDRCVIKIGIQMYTAMPSKNNPNTSGYFHVNLSSVNDINYFKFYVMLLIWSTVLSQVGRMFYLR